MDFKKKISELLKKELKLDLDYESLLEVPPNISLGNYAFPCFKLSKDLKKAPNQIANDLTKIKKPNWIKEIKSNGPYLNFYLNPEHYFKKILKAIEKQKDKFGSSNIGKNKTIVIDYSSPNIAKPFSIAHLRSTAIGNSLYKINSFLGYKVIGINYLGDWGLQFGKLIIAFKKWGDNNKLKENPIKYLYELYVKFHEQESEALENEARAWFCKLENGDKEALDIWKKFSTLSLKEFKKFYTLMDVKFDSFKGEAAYNKDLNKVIRMLKNKGITEMSEGALIVKLENIAPCLLKKKDEASLYATRDIAAAIDRKKQYNFTKALYVVDVRQSLHFQQFFSVLNKAGFEWSKDLEHVPFGLMRFKEGTMSTRKGKIIFLEDVINNAIASVSKIIKQKNPKLKNKEKVAQQVGIGAVFFWDLSHDRVKDLEFDWEKVLDFEGETGPYVQYTFARASSILRKAKKKVASNVDYSLFKQDKEIKLISMLDRFNEVIKDAAVQSKPSVLARFILELAQLFNEFYHICKCLGNDVEKEVSSARLLLVQTTAQVLKNGLNLLGISAPLEM
ncbi:MAG: arginine--tRNA ligase [Nanoarchaeota archaeon]|nr:arginine--tRNA ligase [Nanoarchaeota archaeon]MBU4352150.1 arginine--tRNA ligase [Nanoarchaeota archaeon]MCG2719140.1 arginine--tRNA ligase [Nanoarchaeota archaeon]